MSISIANTHDRQKNVAMAFHQGAFSPTTSSNTHSSPPAPPSQESTPTSRPRSSTSFNFNLTYSCELRTKSYNEIRDKLAALAASIDVIPEDGCEEGQDSAHQLLTQLVHPDGNCVHEALLQAKPSSLISLVSDYFRHSETTSRFCLVLYKRLRLARTKYSSLHQLLDLLPADFNTLSETQFDRAYTVLHGFDAIDNPFSSFDSCSLNNAGSHFSELKQQLDVRLHKSRSRTKLLRCAINGSGVCFIVTALGVVIAAVAVTTHALVTLMVSPICWACIPKPNLIESYKEHAQFAQLDAATKGAYVLSNDLNTIDRLVAWLSTAIDGDKFLIRLALERGRDKHRIQEVLKQLHKNYKSFIRQLNDFEDHIYFCFITINHARSLLFNEICHHQK